MNSGTKATAAAAASIVAFAGVAALSLTSGSSTPSSLPPPNNLRAYEVGPDYAKVSYGPSIVGPLRITPAPNGRSATIRWDPARDDLYPNGITYTFTKNGTNLWVGRAQAYAVVGFTLKVRSFTTCVIPHSDSGFGPKRCVTWNGH